MTLEEFQRIIVAHGGLRDTPAQVGPKTVRRRTPSRYPGQPDVVTDEPVATPTYKYIFNDGTTLTAVTLASGDVQMTDPGTAENKAGVAAGAGAAGRYEWHNGPNGELLRLDKQTGESVIELTKPQGPGLGAAPTLHTLPDGSQASWNPAKNAWDIQFKKPPTAPDIAVPRRPGQRTDLSLLNTQWQLFLQATRADTTLTPEEKERRISTYLETVVKPQVDQATREANEAADRLSRKQEEQTAYERLTEREKEETRQREARLGFGYKAGRDAVSDAMAMLPYETGPSFGPELAGVYNRILGSGTFSPGAFSFPRPDTEALAQRSIDRAMALYDSSVAPRVAAGGVAGAPMGAPTGSPALPQPSSAGTTAAMANVPVAVGPRTGGAAAAPPPAIADPGALIRSATPGVAAGLPSPLPPGWEQLYPRPAEY